MALVDFVFGHWGLKRARYCRLRTFQRLQTGEVVTAQLTRLKFED